MKLKSMIIALFTFGALFAIDAPENLQAVGGDGQIDLNWDAVDGAASYNVYQVVEEGATTGGDCAADEVEDCSGDGDCCPANWIGDGFEDCEEQLYGCDLTCYDNDGGDCDGGTTGGTTTGGTESCDACELDWSEYGSECCDTAWDEYAIDCATLESEYGWDCAGCACPGDVACEDQGLVACAFDGSCAASEADCPQSCEEITSDVYVDDCSGDGDCCLASWIGDGFADCEDQQYGCDLTCYDNDGGDCVGTAASAIGIVNRISSIGENEIAFKFHLNNNTREEYILLGSVTGTEATVTGFNDGDEGCFVVTADDGEGGNIGGSCGTGMIYDCWMQCVDEATALAWIADGYCDDNTWGMYLDCPEFDCDGGDCPDLNCDGGDTGGGTTTGGGDNQACADSFVASGSDPSVGDCYSDGSGYFWLQWEGGCLATEISYSGGDMDITSYGFTAGFYFNGFENGVTETFVLTFTDAQGVSEATNDCATCESQGLVTCELDGSCAASQADCPQSCEELTSDVYVDDCSGDGDCCLASWIGDGYADCEDQAYGCDLTCYDNDGGDCAGTAANAHEGMFKEDRLSRDGYQISNKEYYVVNEEYTPMREESAYSNMACAIASSCATGGTGDVNADGATNVLDIVQIVNYILGSVEFDDCQYASADLNGDGAANVLDIVAIVNLILDGRSADASSARLIDEAGVVSIDADGYIGAVQMTLSHGADFSIELTDKAMVADFATNGNTTTLVVVAPETNQIFTSNGEFEITEMIVANSSVEINVVMATEFSLMAAYPNPFNPSTTLSLYVPENGFVSVKVFNLMGQVVATLAEENMDATNTYSFTWNASDMPSGLYMVRAEAMGQVSSQKLMLLK